MYFMVNKNKTVNVDFKNILYYCSGFFIAALAGLMLSKLSLNIYIILMVGLAFIIFIYYKLEWGLGLLIASMCYEKDFVSGFSLTSIIILPVLVIIFIKILNKEKKIYVCKKTDWIILLLFLWMSLSIFYAHNINLVITSLVTYFQLIMTYFIIF